VRTWDLASRKVFRMSSGGTPNGFIGKDAINRTPDLTNLNCFKLLTVSASQIWDLRLRIWGGGQGGSYVVRGYVWGRLGNMFAPKPSLRRVCEIK